MSYRKTQTWREEERVEGRREGQGLGSGRGRRETDGKKQREIESFKFLGQMVSAAVKDQGKEYWVKVDITLN